MCVYTTAVFATKAVRCTVQEGVLVQSGERNYVVHTTLCVFHVVWTMFSVCLICYVHNECEFFTISIVPSYALLLQILFCV